MNDPIHRIGILTGGGDCPGLNAVIRAVVKSATLDHGWTVMGIPDGYEGLIWPGRVRDLAYDDVSGILHRGGTILGTSNRGDPFAYPVLENEETVLKDLSGQLLANLAKLSLDCLVIIGGDGTLKIGLEMFRRGVPIVAVPKTIDNDLSATEVTFGFDTAVQTVTEAIDKLHSTAESHHRVMLVEVMGRDAGWIALHAGIAGGADVILIPEIPFSLAKVGAKIEQRVAAGRLFSIVVVAEGCRLSASDALVERRQAAHSGQITNAIGNWISREMNRETRVTVLGHIQRGGSPSPSDRVLSTRLGVAAVQLAARGEFGRMVCLRCDTIASTRIEEAVGALKRVDPQGELVKTARSVGISFGDAS